jgi:hypothetical protein
VAEVVEQATRLQRIEEALKKSLGHEEVEVVQEVKELIDPISMTTTEGVEVLVWKGTCLCHKEPHLIIRDQDMNDKTQIPKR